MSEDRNDGADVNVEVMGNKVNLKNVKSLNTLATVATLIVVVLIAYVTWAHGTEAKENGKSLVDAINSMTKAQQDTVRAHRETNCLIGMKESEREAKAEFCKRISQ